MKLKRENCSQQKNQRNANANSNGGNEGSKSYKTYRKPILKWQKFGPSLSVITLAISGLNSHKEAEIGRTDFLKRYPSLRYTTRDLL